MNDHDVTGPDEPTPARPDDTATTEPTAAGTPAAAKVRRLLPSTRRGRVAAAAMLCAVIGLTAACSSTSATATSPSSSATSPSATSSAPAGGPKSGGGGSNARSGPAAGGAVGTVDSVSTSGFTLSTATGQKVTVKEASSTTYKNGTSSTTSSAVKAGDSVLVLGTTDSTTITATQVTVQPNGDGGSATSSAAGVVPFKQGSASESKQVGQIPANYSEGDGTVVSGTEANKATEAALAAYPGGVVDRVVKLSNGEYEVHNIGVNWPHHVFVDQDFKVVGAY
ncbi:hypothetical protein ACFVYF_29405 [Streptomyces sp. NPDC058274]|uniref:hypothetical protein n=1 Tax=Streptomyces sp. NPDC058274 TaxID=3346416 RepID=UPI0036EB252F